MTREMVHPTVEVEKDGPADLRVRFRVDGSTFGPVEVVLSHDEAAELAESIEQASIFAGATGGDSDG